MAMIDAEIKQLINEKKDREDREDREDKKDKNNTIWIILGIGVVAGIGFVIYKMMNKPTTIYDMNGNPVNVTPERQKQITALINVGKVSIGVDASGKTRIVSNTAISLGNGVTIPAGTGIKGAKIVEWATDAKNALNTAWNKIFNKGKDVRAAKQTTTTQTQPTSIPLIQPSAGQVVLTTAVSANVQKSCIYNGAGFTFPIKKSLTTLDSVRELQRMLQKLGAKGINGKLIIIDGKYGNNTKYAVRNFQMTNGIPTGNGEVDYNTLKVLVGKADNKVLL